MEMNLTDNEIIKALEVHITEDINCDKCPYDSNDCMCSLKLQRDALDLINRLQAENERLTNLCQEQNTEIDRLIETKNNLLYNLKAVCEEKDEENIKAEAYKEFAEMLDNHLENETNDEEINICYVIGLIHKCKKELVGEDK